MSETSLISLTEETENMLHIVSNYKLEDMKMIFVKLSALEAALRAANMFHEASIKYAELEAYALIHAVELNNGHPPELSGKNKTVRAEAAMWLYNMTEEERRATIALCEKGKTIASVYSDLHPPDYNERASEIKEQLKDMVTYQLKRNGMCQLSDEYLEKCLRSLPSNLRSDVRDGIRKFLHNKGAVGLHDHKGTYILPESTSNQIYDALEARINSIELDFTSFLGIASKCKKKPIFNIVSKGSQNVYARHIILLLASYYDAITFSASPHISHQIRIVLKEMLKHLDFPVPESFGGYVDKNRLNNYFADELQILIGDYKKHEKNLSKLYPVIEKLAELAIFKDISNEKMDKILEILNN